MDIFEVHILGNNKKILYFGKEKANDKEDDIENIYTSKTISLDDTIQTIKNKILELLNYDITYEELYLFSKKETNISKDDLYNILIQDNDDYIDLETYLNFLKNIDVNWDLEKKDFYYYEDILDIPDVLNTSVFVGNKFEKKNNYLFAIDPLFCENEFTDIVYSSDNSVLLNFTNSNILYVRLAEEILENNKLNGEYIIKTYYPYLYKQNIFSVTSLRNNKIKLKEENKKKITKELLKTYDLIDKYYEIYDRTKDDIFEYNEIGIKNFEISIKNNYQSLLPLDSIFKNIHSTKEIPIIKYNPGFKRDTMYRLYCDKISKNGKKIPYLSTSEIMKYSKEIGGSEEISMLVKHKYNNTTLNVYIFFKRNGNLQIQCDFATEKDNTLQEPEKKINDIMKDCVNKIIDLINEFLEDIGYKIKKFINFNDPSIIIKNIEYVTSLNIKKSMKFKNYINFLSTIFSFNRTSINNDNFDFHFKRVENYTEVDEKDEFIISNYKNTENVSDTINKLIKEFDIARDDAENIFSKCISSYNFVNGEIVENVGFLTNVNFDKSENIIKFYIKNINNVEYLNLIYKYFHSILKLYQDPEKIEDIIKEINELTKKEINFKKIEETKVNNIVAPIEFDTKIDSDFFADEEEEKDEKKMEEFEEDEENENKFFGFDDEEEEEDEEDENMEGGSGDVLEKDLEGKKLKNPNIFQKRIEDRDGKLVLKESIGKFKQYSTTCPSQDSRVPVILNEKEKEKIEKNPNSFTTMIKHSSDDSKKYWYICPRYWSLKKNESLSDEEVKEIIKKEGKQVIIPQKASVVPKGAYIYEFANPKQHFNDKNEYVKHYPGLSLNKHPEGLGIPCCFKNEGRGIEEKKNQPTKQSTQYLIDSNKFPLPEGRMGFLSEQLEIFFNIDNRKYVSKTNPKLLKTDSECILRYGVEQNILQSLIGCYADIYSYINGLKNKLTIKEMIKKIDESITLDEFIKYQNSTLMGIFKNTKKKVTKEKREKYKDTSFYQLIDLTDKSEKNLLDTTIISYENFKDYLNDDLSIMDDKIFWSIITESNEKLLSEEINMVILEIEKDKKEVNLLCPVNAYRENLFDKDKGTWILIKQREYYEPIYICKKDKNENMKYEKLFKKQNENVNYVLENIRTRILQYCIPKKSLLNEYGYSDSLNLSEMKKILEKESIVIENSVMNYQGKIVGLSIKLEDGSVFIPCRPSSYDINLPITTIDDETLWKNYEETKSLLIKVNEITKGKIKCLPIKKIINDGKVIGLKTETNQYLRVLDNKKLEEIKDDLLIDYNNDEINVDIDIALGKEDENIKKNIKYINLESKYYSIFRSTIRLLLENNKNNKIRESIKNIINSNDIKYDDKLKKLFDIIINLSKDYVNFEELNKLYEENEIKNCINDCRNKKNCKIIEDKCMFIIPKYNLLDRNILNEILYHTKISDELIRFNRIRSFILEPNKYLNLVSVDYKINKDEVLLLDSSIKNEYFNELVLFNDNEYLQNIPYEIAEPDIKISKKYSNKVKL